MQERLSGKVMDVVKKNALIPYKIKEAKKKKKWEKERKKETCTKNIYMVILVQIGKIQNKKIYLLIWLNG